MNPQETLQHQLSDLRQAFANLQEELALTETYLGHPDRPPSQPMLDRQETLQRRFLTLQTGIREFGHTLETLYFSPPQAQAAQQTHNPSFPYSPPSFLTVEPDSDYSSSSHIGQVMTTFLHDAEQTIPVVMSAFFETRAYDSTFALVWSNPTGLEEDLQAEAQNQIERGTFSDAFQHNAALVCASHGLHHYHPRVRSLILVPLTAAPTSDGIILVATEREANNVKTAQLVQLDTIAERAISNGEAPQVEAQERALVASAASAASADEEDISEQDLMESPQAPALDSDIFNEQEPPQLTPVTVVHAYDSSEQERPASSRVVPRWMLFSTFTLGLLLVFPFLRQQQSPHLPVQPERQQSDTSDTPPDPRLPPSLPRLQGPHWLNIQAIQEVWLSVMIDQVETKETFLKPGDQVVWVANTDFVVSVDKPDGVRLIFNGNELAPVREREQERLPLHLPPTAADTEKGG